MFQKENKKNKVSVVVLFLMVLIVLSPIAQGETADAKGAGVRHAKVEKVAKQGNQICVSTLKGIYVVNRKTGKQKKLSAQKHITQMLMYKGYLYYSLFEKDLENTYRVELSSGKSTLFLQGTTVDFVKNNRLYYFKDGICSIDPDGKNEKKHMPMEGATGTVCFYKNRYYYQYNIKSASSEGQDGEEADGQYGSASVNKNFKGMKKNKNFWGNASGKVFDTFYSASSVCTNQKSYFSLNWDEPYVESFRGKKKYKVYISKKKYLVACGAGDGYILIREGNKRKKKVENPEASVVGKYSIITTKGKVVCTLK